MRCVRSTLEYSSRTLSYPHTASHLIVARSIVGKKFGCLHRWLCHSGWTYWVQECCLACCQCLSWLWHLPFYPHTVRTHSNIWLSLSALTHFKHFASTLLLQIEHLKSKLLLLTGKYTRFNCFTVNSRNYTRGLHSKAYQLRVCKGFCIRFLHLVKSWNPNWYRDSRKYWNFMLLFRSICYS